MLLTYDRMRTHRIAVWTGGHEGPTGATVYDFVPGMVFAVEPLVWVPDVRGGGGVRIEDMVLITEGAPEVLSRVEYEERLLL